MYVLDEVKPYEKVVCSFPKLFVVGGFRKSTCDVFDSTCAKFILLKELPPHFQTHLDFPAEVISIGSKLFVLDTVRPRHVLFYDV